MPRPMNPLPDPEEAAPGPWRGALHRVIFRSDTPAGRAFDVLLLVAIAASVLVATFESVPGIQAALGSELRALEWAFTLLFTLEYALRLLSLRRPASYALSFFGVVDLLALLPTWLSLLLPGAQALMVVRAFRLLRVFRVLRLSRYFGESLELLAALGRARHKVTVFLVAVLGLVLTAGSLLYVVEGPASGFSSLPVSFYWAIVTVTTVGYGDIAPVTPLGQLLASILMLLGYGIIAVPTGIVTTELVKGQPQVKVPPCPACGSPALDDHSRYCHRCGCRLDAPPPRRPRMKRRTKP